MTRQSAPTGGGTPISRGMGARRRVLQAALHVLDERGLAGFTMEAVARRAGASKATLYRHWPTSSALLVDAMDATFLPFPIPDTGLVETDIAELLTAFVALLEHAVPPPARRLHRRRRARPRPRSAPRRADPPPQGAATRRADPGPGPWSTTRQRRPGPHHRPAHRTILLPALRRTPPHPAEPDHRRHRPSATSERFALRKLVVGG